MPLDAPQQLVDAGSQYGFIGILAAVAVILVAVMGMTAIGVIWSKFMETQKLLHATYADCQATSARFEELSRDAAAAIKDNTAAFREEARTLRSVAASLDAMATAITRCEAGGSMHLRVSEQVHVDGAARG